MLVVFVFLILFVCPVELTLLYKMEIVYVFPNTMLITHQLVSLVLLAVLGVTLQQLARLVIQPVILRWCRMFVYA